MGFQIFFHCINVVKKKTSKNYIIMQLSNQGIILVILTRYNVTFIIHCTATVICTSIWGKHRYHWTTTLAGSSSSSWVLGDDGTTADRGRRFVGLPLRGGWGLVALLADIALGDFGFCRMHNGDKLYNLMELTNEEKKWYQTKGISYHRQIRHPIHAIKPSFVDVTILSDKFRFIPSNKIKHCSVDIHGGLWRITEPFTQPSLDYSNNRVFLNVRTLGQRMRQFRQKWHVAHINHDCLDTRPPLSWRSSWELN